MSEFDFMATDSNVTHLCLVQILACKLTLLLVALVLLIIIIIIIIIIFV